MLGLGLPFASLMGLTGRKAPSASQPALEPGVSMGGPQGVRPMPWWMPPDATATSVGGPQGTPQMPWWMPPGVTAPPQGGEGGAWERPQSRLRLPFASLMGLQAPAAQAARAVFGGAGARTWQDRAGAGIGAPRPSQPWAIGRRI